jgi:hypothetical protein
MDKFIRSKSYGDLAFERLYNKYGSMYELPYHLSDNYMKIAQNAFGEFIEDIENLDPELMDWFDQNEDYNDEPDIKKLEKTAQGRETLAQYMELGWQPKMTSKENNFGIYKFVLKLLENSGAKIPNLYLSEDRNFSVSSILKDKNIRTAFIGEISKLSHETLLKFMPQEYMIRTCDAAIDEFQKPRRRKKIL